MNNKKFIWLVVFSLWLFAMALTLIVFDARDFWIIANSAIVAVLIGRNFVGERIGGYLLIRTGEDEESYTPVLKIRDVLRKNEVIHILVTDADHFRFEEDE